MKTLVAALLIGAAQPAGAQLRTLATTHFRIHFMPSAQGTARRVAETAEEVFASLAAAYDYYDDFQTIHVLVLDSSDMLGNGQADYYSDTIYIWATSLDMELRGSHDWIRNVMTHELTHIITLNKARRKWPFQFALIQVSRFDANPDISFSFPLYHMSAPRGWAEGIAQYGARKFGYDTWDSHRDMVLRMAVLEDDLLTYEELGTVQDRTGKYYGELLYNQGYAMMIYIEDQYGAAQVDELTQHSGTMSFDPAIRRVLGISADQLYAEWKQYVRTGYEAQIAALREEGLFEGTPHEALNEGIIEYYPSYSPDGVRLAFVSSEDREFPIPYLRIHDFVTGETRTLPGYASSRSSWSPDGTEIVFARNKNGFNDLFIYNWDSEREHRISARLRAKDPAFSPDGERIAFVRNEDGTNNLALVNRDGTGLVLLTNNDDGTQYWSPRWSPDGKWILFNVFRDEDRDIAMIRADSPARPRNYGIRDRSLAAVPDSLRAFPDTLAIPAADTSGFRVLLGTRFDERDPCWLADGSGFLFSSDRTGIYNIYLYELETGETQRLTNVPGGAFVPTVAFDGRVTYSGYHANNYDLYEFKLGEYSRPAPSVLSVDRDYHSLVRLPSLEDEYAISPYRGRKIVSYVPILQVGPTYVGNTFGLNQVSAGLQISTGEMLGGERLNAWALLGENLKDDTDLNSEFGLYYERSLLPRVGNNRVFNPSAYVAVRRRQIDNLVKTRNTTIDTIPRSTLYPVAADTADLLLPGVEQYQYSVTERRDLFKSTFTQLALGIHLPLTRRQQLVLQYARLDYNENWDLQRYRSQARIFVIQDSVNVSAQLPADTRARLSRDTVMVSARDPRTYYHGLDFYDSDDVSVIWSYRSLRPTANRSINPKGRAAAVMYRMSQPTVVDYVVDLGVDASVDPPQLRGDHVDDFGFPADEFGVRQDRFAPVKRHLQVNEYVATYMERVGLPFDNTLSLSVVGGLRDLRLPDSGDEEGRTLEGRYYWPLRYYLGGMNNLSGYPYFSVWGSSMFYAKVGYTFPVFPRLSRRLLNLTFSKLYAELFAEAGAVGNSGDLDAGRWDTDGVLTDAGVELRLQVFSFYRIPMSAFFQAARPFNRDRVPRDADEASIDKWRYYFGFGFR